MIKIKIPKEKSLKEINSFFIKIGLGELIKESKKKIKPSKELKQKKIIKPKLKELYRLYQFVELNKRTTILEFGSGWSSLIFNISLNNLKKKYENKISNLRRKNPFELFILENKKKYLNITKKKIKKYNDENNLKKIPKTHYCFSDTEMTLFQDRISTQYKKMPLCNPDFIYLDGPDQFNVKKNINGINTGHGDLMPMVCDILKFEYFLTPGTIIVCDGRSANAKFMKDHFKRNWKYINNTKNDEHIFWLDDPPLGKLNKLQLNFYDKN